MIYITLSFSLRRSFVKNCRKMLTHRKNEVNHMFIFSMILIENYHIHIIFQQKKNLLQKIFTNDFRFSAKCSIGKNTNFCNVPTKDLVIFYTIFNCFGYI